ncbi:hypothetical protein Tco_1525553 [Tanacetum coccineum]
MLMHSSIPGIHKNQELAGSPRFSGNLLQDGRQNNVHSSEVSSKTGFMGSSSTSVSFSLFPSKVRRVRAESWALKLEHPEEKLKVSVWHGSNNRSINGLKELDFEMILNNRRLTASCFLLAGGHRVLCYLMINCFRSLDWSGAGAEVVLLV